MIDKEKRGLERRDAWDYNTVRSFRDWMTDASMPEAVIGRIFIILGKKNAELELTTSCSEAVMKASAVFQ